MSNAVFMMILGKIKIYSNLFRLCLLRIVSSVVVINKLTVLKEASILGRKLGVLHGKGILRLT